MRLLRTWKPWVGGLGAMGLVLVVVLAVGNADDGGVPVLLEPASSLGPDPFLEGPELELVVSSRVFGSTIQLGDEPGLYGGSGEERCDPAAIADFLLDNPDRGRAWAEVHGLDLDDVPDYLADLTPAVLQADTWVTNHGFRDGRATPRQSILQAGTAVLVDDEGVPRVRCRCGNPLLEGELPADLGDADIVNPDDAWDGFELADVIGIVGEQAMSFLSLTDLDGRFPDADFVGRLTGTIGDVDVAVVGGKLVPPLEAEIPRTATLATHPVPLPAETLGAQPISYRVTGACSRSGNRLRFDEGGRCTVHAEAEAEGDWAAAERTWRVEVLASAPGEPQLIVVPDLDPDVVEGDVVTVDATATSGLPVEFAAVGPCEVDDGVVTMTGAGECTVTLTQPGDADHPPAEPVTIVFTIGPPPEEPPRPSIPSTTTSTEPEVAGPTSTSSSTTTTSTTAAGRRSQAIYFPSVADLLVNEERTLIATTSSGLEVTFRRLSGQCTLIGDRLRADRAGTCVVEASQPGDSTYAPASPVVRSVQMVRRSVAITIDVPVRSGVGETFTPDVTVSPPAAGPATLSVSGTCTRSGSTVRGTSTGTCTVEASTAADGVYEAASATAVVEIADLDPARLVDAEVVGPGSIRVHFTEPVRCSGVAASAFVYDDRSTFGDSDGTASSVAPVGGDPATACDLAVSGVQGDDFGSLTYSRPTAASTRLVGADGNEVPGATVTVSDRVAPGLRAASSLGPSDIHVDLGTGSVPDSANCGTIGAGDFTVTVNGVAVPVVGASCGPTSRTVALSVGHDFIGGDTVTVTVGAGVFTDPSGNPNRAASVSFVMPGSGIG